MDPWKENAAWQECRDAVRAWAALEGKSATMREDLYRSAVCKLAANPRFLPLIAVLVDVGMMALDVLRVLRSR
jgi:hypothetical protein